MQLYTPRLSVKLAFSTRTTSKHYKDLFTLSKSSVKLAFRVQTDLYLVTSEGSFSPHVPVFTCIHVHVHVSLTVICHA